MDFVLDELDLRDYFTGVLQAEDVSEGKPHPEIYLKAAALTGSDPADCIVYEDSPTGALAASRAGSKIIVLTTTHTRKEFEGIDGIDKFISDFTELNYR